MSEFNISENYIYYFMPIPDALKDKVSINALLFYAPLFAASDLGCRPTELAKTTDDYWSIGLEFFSNLPYYRIPTRSIKGRGPVSDESVSHYTLYFGDVFSDSASLWEDTPDDTVIRGYRCYDDEVADYIRNISRNDIDTIKDSLNYYQMITLLARTRKTTFDLQLFEEDKRKLKIITLRNCLMNKLR